MFGLLNLNKPPGWTSRDAVNRVQRLAPGVKAGHAGTLDPLAVGVLVVCLGPATRLIPFVQATVKTYRGVFLLGRTSPSDDTETDATELPKAPHPTLADVEAVLPQFTGSILQRPPAYSAKKVAGQRAYRLARKGELTELAPHRVEVYQLDVVRYAYPELELFIRCSSGTYVRSIGRDVAVALGSGAVMSELERTAVGQFHIDTAVDADALNRQALEASLQPPLAALPEMPRQTLNDEQEQNVRHGRRIVIAAASEEQYAAIGATGQLAAILQREQDGSYRPSPNFSQPG